MGMTKEEKFRFDLQGFLVVKNVLSADEVDALNKLADEVWSAGGRGWQWEPPHESRFNVGSRNAGVVRSPQCVAVYD